MSPIEFAAADRVGRLTFRRPADGNAFTTEMMTLLLEAVQRAASEADTLVIAGEGEDFCLGRDRNEKSAAPPFEAFRLVIEANAALAAFPGVSLALVRGRAFGFGAGLILRTDIALAGEGARFAFDEIEKGIAPMIVMSEILDHLSPKSAAEMIFAGRELGAAEAREAGLVSRVVAERDLADAGEALVARLRARDAAVLRASKRYLAAIREVPRAARPAYALAEQTKFALGAAKKT